MAATQKAAKQAAPEAAWSPTPLASWEQEFVDLLNNRDEPKRRQHGFLVVVRDTPSLQPLQAACSKQSWNACLTARYRFDRAPVFGSLFRAFADSALAGASSANPPIGDYFPPYGGGSWPHVLRSVGERMTEFFGYGTAPPTGSVTAEELEALLEVLGNKDVLGRGRRLVLFAEFREPATDATEWAQFRDTVLPQLPERVGVVVSGPPGSFELPRDDPHVLELADLPVEGSEETFRYRLSALRGDQPSATDLLGLGTYADALARFVLMPQTDPLTIGIHGPWGKGKSSFMMMIEQTLEDPARIEQTSKDPAHEGQRVVTVWFNAWRYQDATQIWAGLASTISRAIEQSLPRAKRLWSPVAYAWGNRRARFVLDLVVPALLLIAALGIFALAGWDELDAWATRELGPTWGPLVPAGALAVVAVGLLAARLNKIVQPVSERLLEYVRLPDHRENMGYQHRVLDDLAFIRDRLPESTRVVVFIDDLDRCTDEKIMEILQAIHLILGQSDFYVLLGIDTVMIYRAIEAHYPEGEGRRPLESDFPERYLRKIIQLPFHLPETSTTDVFLKNLFSKPAQTALETSGREETETQTDAAAGGAFAYDLGTLTAPVVQVLREVEDTPDELQAFLDFRRFCADNPRELKRLVNVHRLVKILLQRPDAPLPEESRRKLVKWLVFCAAWPDLVDDALRVARDDPKRSDPLAAFSDRIGKFAGHVDERDVLNAEDLAPGGLLALAASLTNLVLPDALPLADAEGAVSPDGATPGSAGPSPVRSAPGEPAASRAADAS
jgi:hypothetical protein